MSRSNKREQPRRDPLTGSGEIPPPQDKIAAFLERRSLVLALALILLGSVRIAATYKVFNHVVDEPGNIAAGMEWLEKGVYQWEAQHPPLARVVCALGPYLLGIRSQGTPHQGLGLAVARRHPDPLSRPRLRPHAGDGALGNVALLLDRVPGGVLVGLPAFLAGRRGDRRFSVQFHSPGAGARRFYHHRHGVDGLPRRGVRGGAGLGGTAVARPRGLVWKRRRG